MTAPPLSPEQETKPASKWANTLSVDLGAEMVRRWNCHNHLMAALESIAEEDGFDNAAKRIALAALAKVRAS